MSLQSSMGKLTHGGKQLNRIWQDAERSWSDRRAKAFGEKYMETLEQDLRQALAAMEQMAEALHRCKRDCQ